MMPETVVQGAGQAAAIVFIFSRTDCKPRTSSRIPDFRINTRDAVSELAVLDIF